MFSYVEYVDHAVHSRPGSIQDIYNIFDGLVKESRRPEILRLIDVGQSFTG
jgi:hypothetical protein